VTPRARAVCRRSLCSAPVHRAGLCREHTADAERERGSSTARGYGAEHRARREELLPLAEGQPCPICGEPMWPDREALDLGHTVPLWVDANQRAGDAIQHRACNPRGTDPRNHAPQSPVVTQGDGDGRGVAASPPLGGSPRPSRRSGDSRP